MGTVRGLAWPLGGLANVRGGGGDSGSEAARRSDPHESGAGAPPPRGSGGHRAFRLGWSCDASSWWRTDDRGQTATGRAAAEGRRRGFPADRRRGGAAAADGERRGGPDRGRALRAQQRLNYRNGYRERALDTRLGTL